MAHSELPPRLGETSGRAPAQSPPKRVALNIVSADGSRTPAPRRVQPVEPVVTPKLKREPKQTRVTEPVQTTADPVGQPKRKSKAPLGAAALVGLAAIAGVGFVVNTPNQGGPDPAPSVKGTAAIDPAALSTPLGCPTGEKKHFYANDVADKNAHSMGNPIVPKSMDDEGAKDIQAQFWTKVKCDPTSAAQVTEALAIRNTHPDQFDNNAAQKIAAEYDSNPESWQKGLDDIKVQLTSFDLIDGGTKDYMSVGQVPGNGPGDMPTFTTWGLSHDLGPVLVAHTQDGKEVPFRLECNIQYEQQKLAVVVVQAPPPVTVVEQAPPPVIEQPPVYYPQPAPPPVILPPPPILPPPILPPPYVPPPNRCTRPGGCGPHPGCQYGLCSKNPANTPQGPNVPGQNGHTNAIPGPGQYQDPGQVTRPSSPLPRQNPGMPPAQVGPGIIQQPRQEAPPAPIIGANRPGGGGSGCPPMGCAMPGSLGGF